MANGTRRCHCAIPMTGRRGGVVDAVCAFTGGRHAGLPLLESQCSVLTS